MWRRRSRRSSVRSPQASRWKKSPIRSSPPDPPVTPMAGATGERRPLRVEMRAVSKRFGETAALREVDFTLERGEIHGLLGENGAGKTTLMNVLSGLCRADAGTIVLDGRRVDLHSPADALRHG